MKKAFLFVLFLFSFTFAEVSAPSLAKWLWTSEKFEDSRNQQKLFRQEFDVNGEIKCATINWVIDDEGALTINGSNVEDGKKSRNAWPKCSEVTAFVKQGRNAIACDVDNHIGVGGLVAHLEIEYADGRVQDICTNGDWRATMKKAEGWRLVGFNDANWEKARAFADISVYPWAIIYPMERLLTRDEVAARNALYARRNQRGLEIKRKLANLEKPKSSVLYENGRPFFKIGKKTFPVIIYSASDHIIYDNRTWRDQVKMLCKSGILVHAVTINVNDSIWKSDGTLDLDAAEKIVQDYLELAPDTYLSVGINFSRMPLWWRAKHPEECVDYANGGRDLKETNVQRNFVAPSFASKLWLKETDEIITKIVKRLEASPLSARIFSYRLDYGIYTEWHYYGMPKAMPDVSRPMQEAFCDYLKKKYKTEAALRKAWGDSKATFENAVPLKDERMKTSAGQLRSPEKERKVLDYLDCQGMVVRDLCINMNRAAKKASNGRALVGNYCGYFFCMNYPAEGWHLHNDEILDDAATDFQISPFNYGADFRALGQDGHPRSLADSYRTRGKLCILESDTRTHLEPNTGGHTFATNDEESIALLSRDLANAYAHGTGLWFMDFAKSWYMTPKLQEFFLKNMQTFLNHKGDYSSAAEVAVIGDFDSVPFHATETNPSAANFSITNETPREIAHCQIPYDMLSFGDLSKPNVKEYKVYVFLNNYFVSPEKRAVIDNLKRNGHTLLWMHAPGYFTESKASVKNIESLTGMKVKLMKGEARLQLLLSQGVGTEPRNLMYAPVFVIQDKSAKVFGNIMVDGKRQPALAVKKQNGWTSVLCTVPYMPREAFAEIFKEAGVFRYCDSQEGVVYANESMLMLHTGNAGKYTLHFPQKVKWSLFFPEKKDYATSNTLEFNAKAHTTYFFQISI